MMAWNSREEEGIEWGRSGKWAEGDGVRHNVLDRKEWGGEYSKYGIGQSQNVGENERVMG
jgi:hypothetical protein